VKRVQQRAAAVGDKEQLGELAAALAPAPTWYEPGMEASTSSQPTSDRNFYVFNAVVSVSAVAFLFYILVIRRGTAGTGLDLRFMPAVNASLNALSACLLVTGWIAIRRKAVQLHKYCQVSAFVSSSLFLIGYLAYHFVHGDTKFQGRGPIRAIYLLILASHIVLSVGIVPMALTSLYFAWKRAFVKHRAIARVTLPIWLYVSVTGVVIFFMLRGSVPAVP
jgi:putative membrane protein